MADQTQPPSGQAPEQTSEFRSAAQLRHPRQFLRTGSRSLRASLPLARRLFARDIRARYRLSALGFAWIILPALAQTGIWLFLNASNILNSGETDIPLPVFILVGTLLWQTFVDAMFAPGNQLMGATGMLSHVSFPPESLMLAGLADAAVNSIVRLTIAVPVLIWYKVTPGWSVLLAPFGLASLLLLGFAIGLAVAPFGMLYQDLTRLLTIGTGFWLLVTPVAFQIPETGPGRILTLVNPVSPPLSTTRDWLTGGGAIPGWSMVAVVAVSLVLTLCGWVLFRLSVPHLIDRIGT
jgi:lipopolysaccharide transport system permease protein